MPSDVRWAKLPECPWTIIRNYSEFRNVILNLGIPEFVAYDHDLADTHYGYGLKGDEIDYNQYTEKTGYDCCQFLLNQVIFVKSLTITMEQLNYDYLDYWTTL